MKMHIIIASIILVLISTGNLPAQVKAYQNKHGKEYHVSVNGDDANDGSLSKPFKTIMAAANAAMPGDFITVHAGIYREQIVPPRGGNSNEERITYRAAKGEKVIIKGSETVTGWIQFGNGVWQVKIANTFFGKFNPYSEIIKGDWFDPGKRVHHRGTIYLNDRWLMEADSTEELSKNIDLKNLLWYANVDKDSTTLFAQFGNKNPNKELVEINVRPTVFYPDKPFINYITVSGFIMEQAATNWAPPTAEQEGLMGTHWSKGWIIENNKIFYSKCTGISLGKYGDQFDNKNTESAIGYVGTINRALAFGWNKGTVGSHIVRNNEVAYCEQAGIVGSMGCSFSVVQNNYIHHNYIHKLFTGAEMAGIKFHGAIDVQINHNRINNNGFFGIWLDWMAQGAEIKNNLMYNNDCDVFLEVDHGPVLICNNVFLSNQSLFMNSSGAAFVHNIFSGMIKKVSYDARLTPFMEPHSTYVTQLHDNPSGDVKFFNNLFVNGADVSEFSSALLPVVFDGNVYTRGSKTINKNKTKNKFGEMHEDAKKQMANYQEQFATEANAIVDTTFDVKLNLIDDGKKNYIELLLNKNWLQNKRKLVTTKLMGKSIVADLPFENTDGTSIIMDKDYFGKERNLANISPGCFEIGQGGKQRFELW